MWRLLVKFAVNCVKKPIDQSVRCLDDMFGTWKPSAFNIGDEVPKSSNALLLDCLLHLEKVPILLGMARIGRCVIA